LREAGFDVFEGRIASILVHLGEDAPTAKEVCRRCAEGGVFLRDARDFGPSVGERVIRISVKDRASNARIVELLRKALHPRGPAEA
jgi:histidinol-phosphate/aromatic aminotransferase/cobyric acid decarboxylase-like protein